MRRTREGRRSRLAKVFAVTIAIAFVASIGSSRADTTANAANAANAANTANTAGAANANDVANSAHPANAPAAAIGEVRVYGNTTTLELAPVHVVAEETRVLSSFGVSVTNGGIPNLFNPGEADVATNAETQALRQSVDHPDLRIIFTVSEGFYRVLARRSSGITKLADLRGKKIGTVPRTSSAYYLSRMLATEGLTEADVTIVPMVPLDKIPGAMKRGEIDAATVWEPEIEKAAQLLGADAIVFQDRSVYRELFNLNTTAANLANPAKRAGIVRLVRMLIRASAQIRRDPQQAITLLSKATHYDEKLIGQVWHHEGYPGTLVPDLLDVMTAEEPWIAKERNRTPRSRAELAKLIDESIVREALEQERALDRSISVDERVAELAAKVEGGWAICEIERLRYSYSLFAEAGR